MKRHYFLIISILFTIQVFLPTQLNAQNCSAPTQLSVAVNSQTSATLSWEVTNTLSLYNVKYQSVGNPDWVVLNNVSSPLSLTGLNCGGVYVCQVQQICSQSATTPGSLSDWTNITFTTLSCTTPTPTPCVTPTGLVTSNISQSGAVLNLTPAASTNNLYNIRYHSGNATTWITLNNVTLPYQLGNLPCATTFEWQVQRVCGTTPGTVSAISPWSLSSAFTTLQCVNPCTTPTGSTTTNITQTSAVLNWNPNIIATPSIYNIRYKTSSTAPWVVVTNVSLPYQLGNLTCSTGYVWQVQQVCTGAMEPSPWSTGTTFSTLTCSNTCVTPTGLLATNINQTGVVLNAANATTNNVYNIRYHAGNSTTWITLNNVTLPYQLGNLACGTVFEWQAQQVCGTTPGTISGLSPWSLGSAFTTLQCANPCTTPTGSTTTNITQTSAVLNWNPNIIATPSIYNIRYKTSSTAPWVVVTNVSLPYQLGNLTCSTGYIWQVQQVCTGAMEPSPWSTGTTFSTIACSNPCVTPTGLVATNMSQAGVVLNVTNATTNNVYNIRYHAGNSTTWITLSNVTLPYQLGNLACGTVFEWQAQQVCGQSTGTVSGLSPWSVGAAFTTLQCSTPCVAPTALSTTNITQNSAVLNWTGVPNTYNIRYRSANSTVWIVVNNVTSPYQLSNLPCSAGYVWQVQQVCTTTPEPSPWSIGSTFSTIACPNPCVAPIGLVATNTTPTSVVLNVAPPTPSGVYNIRYHSGNSTAWIVINNVTLPYQLGNLPCGTGFEWQMQRICNTTPGTNLELSPWSVGAAFSTMPCPNPCVAPSGLTVTTSQNSAVLTWAMANTSAVYNVQYRMDGNPNWTVLNNVSAPLTLTGLNCGGVYIAQVQQVCSNLAGAAIVSPWSTVTFTTMACVTPCIAPTGLTATDITQTGVVLTLVPTASTNNVYNIRYHSGNSNTWITLTNVTLPYQLGNLPCGTVFEWQVQRVCNATSPATPNTNLSPWSPGAAFSTLACPNPCVAPIGLSATNITQTGAVLYWGPTTIVNGVYNIRYHSSNGTWITVNNVTLPYQLGNLACGTVFEWQVQRVCGNSATSAELSPWSPVAVFTTLSCTNPNQCMAPTGLMTTNINQTSAVLHSGSVTAVALLYNIRYRSANSTAWIVVNNVTLPYQLGNLNCSSGYVWQAQRICGTASGANSELSPWSVGSTFSTSTCIIPCAAPTELSANEIAQTSAFLHWGVVSGAVAYIVSYKQLNALTAFTTVTTNTNSILLNGLNPGTGYTYQVRAICSNGTTASSLSPLSSPHVFTTLNALVIYPNPANQVIRMSYVMEETSSVTIELRDSFGHLVASSSEMAIEGSNEFTIDTSGVSDGLYLLSIKTNSDNIVSKVFIKH